MNTPIAINHKAPTTNYIGIEDGAEPVKVYRTAKFTVAHVGEPVREKFFNNDFRTVKFVDQSNGRLFTNPLLADHFGRLAYDLSAGATVEIVYEVGTGWIKSVNGKRWN
jgi:hypothetical protein